MSKTALLPAFLVSFLLFLDDKYNPTTLVFPTFLHTLGVRKATTTHLYLFAKNRVQTRNPQGIAAVRLQSWDDPARTQDDDEITVYGVNSGQNVVIYNTSMNSIGIYGLYEKGERALNAPTAITAHADGEVYLADTGNDRIVHFVNPKRELQFVCAIGRQGKIPGEFAGPRGVALTASKLLFVADTENHRVQVFRTDRLEKVWGEAGKHRGQLWRPSAIAATDSGEHWSYYKDNFAVVIDLEGKRLQKFSLDGRHLADKGVEEFADASAQLSYCAIDYYSNIYVTDLAHHCIHKFDRQLNYLCRYGRYGQGDKEFIEPRGIAIYKRFGQVLIAEKEAAQYYWVGTDIFELRISGHYGRSQDGQLPRRGPFLQVDYFLTEPSFVTLQVFDENGSPVGTPVESGFRFSGRQREIVNGRWQAFTLASSDASTAFHDTMLQAQEPVPRGKYAVRVKVAATYSSYKYFEKAVESEVDLRAAP